MKQIKKQVEISIIIQAEKPLYCDCCCECFYDSFGTYCYLVGATSLFSDEHGDYLRSDECINTFGMGEE